MDKQKKNKIIWGLIILAIIVGLAFLIWSLLQQRAATPPGEEEYVPPKIDMPSADLEFKQLEASLGEAEFNAVTLAKTYAERFGSWSTDSAGYNLAELEPKSTSKMNAYLNNIEPDPQAEYQGISTKALSTETLSISETDAKIKVSTQRTATDVDLKINVYYQDAEITLIKSGETWLVDSAYWQ